MATINLKVKSDLAKASADLKKLGNVSSEEAKRIEKYRKSFSGKQIDKFIDKNRRLVASYKATGNEMKGLRSGQKDLQRRMQSLIKRGIDPQSEEIRQLQEEYDRLGDQAARAGRSLKKSLDGVASKATSAGRGLSVGLTLPLVGLAAKSVQAFDQQEEALKRLDAAILATGRESQISAGGIADLAAELQKTTTFGDEATIKAAALTQQFANLDEEGLRKVIPSLQDFAAAMGTEIDDAAKLVGKTLGSSTNALSRYGIEIDMTGDKTEKLAELTEALESKFGGTAEALAQTAGGQLEQARNRLGDVTEEIGAHLLPVIADLAEAAAGIAERFSDLDRGTQQTIIAISGMAAAIGPLLIGLGSAIRGAMAAKAAFAAMNAVILANPYVAAGAALAGVSVALIGIGRARRKAELKQIEEDFDGVVSTSELTAKNIDSISKAIGRSQFDQFQDAAGDVDRLSESLDLSKKTIVDIALKNENITDEYREQLEAINDNIQARIDEQVINDANAFSTQQAALAERGRLQAIANSVKRRKEELKQQERQAELDKMRLRSSEQIKRLDELQRDGIIEYVDALEQMKSIRQEELDLLREKAVTQELTQGEIDRIELLTGKIGGLERKLEDAADAGKESGAEIADGLMVAMNTAESVISSTRTEVEKYQSKIDELVEAQAKVEEGSEAYIKIAEAIDILGNKMDDAEGKGEEAAESIKRDFSSATSFAASSSAKMLSDLAEESEKISELIGENASDLEKGLGVMLSSSSSMISRIGSLMMTEHFQVMRAEINQTAMEAQSAARTTYETQISAADQWLEAENARLDSWYQRQLEIHGLAEETKIERLQRELEEARAAGDQELVDEKEKELQKAKLQKEYRERQKAAEEKARADREKAEKALAEEEERIEREKRLAIYEMEVEQFNNEKTMAATQAGINGALAAAQTWATLGWPVGAVGAAIVAGITAGLVTEIATAPPPPAPSFETGTSPGGFTVPDTGGGVDSQPIMVNPGETVDVTPRGEATGTANISVFLDSETLIQVMNQKIESGEIRITADNIQGGMAG